MLARCTHCESTFVTQQFGRQRCPKCNVDVLVEDPRAPVEEVVAARVAVEPTAESTPWERRAELGVLPALGQTIAAVIGRPKQFFSRMRYDTDDGALSYFALVTLVPVLVSDVISWLTTNPTEMKDAIAQLKSVGLFDQYAGFNQYIDQAMRHAEFNATGRGLVVTLVSSVAFTTLGLFVTAGVAHGILALFRQARGGWTATLKATIYAGTPFLFVIVPTCGGIVAGLWASTVQIYALTRAHRTSVGMATAAVVGVDVLALTCVGGAFGVGLALAHLGL